jgi:acetylglutamate kinase
MKENNFFGAGPQISPLGEGGEKLLVIKIGGNVVDDEAALTGFIQNFAAIKERKILIHGGGKLATTVAERLGIKQTMVEGRRITDVESLKVVIMVYAGFINKSIVAKLQGKGCNAMGLSGPDGNLITAHKRENVTIDYGFAGDIDSINVPLIKNLVQQDLSLVISAITHDQKGQLLNTNADTIAQQVANSLSAEFDTRLIYLFEKPGVLMNVDDDKTVIPRINPGYYRQLKEKQLISSGMIPKIENAFEALNKGVKQVVIGKSAEIEKLIAGTAGTTITNDE